MIVAVPPSGPSRVGLGQGWAREATAAAGTRELPWAWLGRLAGPPAAPHAVVTTLRPTTIAIAARIAHPSADHPWTPATPQQFRTRQISGGPLPRSPTRTGVDDFDARTGVRVLPLQWQLKASATPSN